MRRILLRAALGMAIIAIAILLIRLLGGATRLTHLKDAVWHLRFVEPRLLGIATCLNVLSLLANGMLWTRLLRCMGHRLPFRVGLSAYLSAGLAGYVASAGGSIVGTAVILRRHGVRPGRIVLVTLLANALGFCGVLVWALLAAALFLGLDMRVPLPFVGRHGMIALALLLATVAVAMVVVLQALAAAPRAHNALSKRLLGGCAPVGRRPVPMRPLLALIPWAALAWLFAALAFFVIVSGLRPQLAQHPIAVIGSGALASALGALAFFVPEGLGVREGLFLTLLTHTTHVPLLQAAMVVVALRALDPLTKMGLLLALGVGHHVRRRWPVLAAGLVAGAGGQWVSSHASRRTRRGSHPDVAA